MRELMRKLIIVATILAATPVAWADSPLYVPPNSAVPASAMPALTGDCTSTAGTVATACKVTSATINTTYDLTTASGTQTISGFGFTPSACDGFGNVASSGSNNTTYAAHSDSALTQTSLFQSGTNIAQANSVFFSAVNSGGTAFQQGVITAYNSGSITITWTKTSTPTGTFNETVRCFK